MESTNNVLNDRLSAQQRILEELSAQIKEQSDVIAKLTSTENNHNKILKDYEDKVAALTRCLLKEKLRDITSCKSSKTSLNKYKERATLRSQLNTEQSKSTESVCKELQTSKLDTICQEMQATVQNLTKELQTTVNNKSSEIQATTHNDTKCNQTKRACDAQSSLSNANDSKQVPKQPAKESDIDELETPNKCKKSRRKRQSKEIKPIPSENNESYAPDLQQKVNETIKKPDNQTVVPTSTMDGQTPMHKKQIPNASDSSDVEYYEDACSDLPSDNKHEKKCLRAKNFPSKQYPENILEQTNINQSLQQKVYQSPDQGEISSSPKGTDSSDGTSETRPIGMSAKKYKKLRRDRSKKSRPATIGNEPNISDSKTLSLPTSK